MDQGKLSVASVAVDVASEVFDTFADKTVLVIGAGQDGRPDPPAPQGAATPAGSW